MICRSDDGVESSGLAGALAHQVNTANTHLPVSYVIAHLATTELLLAIPLDPAFASTPCIPPNLIPRISILGFARARELQADFGSHLSSSC